MSNLVIAAQIQGARQHPYFVRVPLSERPEVLDGATYFWCFSAKQSERTALWWCGGRLFEKKEKNDVTDACLYSNYYLQAGFTVDCVRCTHVTEAHFLAADRHLTSLGRSALLSSISSSKHAERYSRVLALLAACLVENKLPRHFAKELICLPSRSKNDGGLWCTLDGLESRLLVRRKGHQKCEAINHPSL